MDFLWLFCVYVISVFVCVLFFCLAAGRSRSNVNRLLDKAERVFSLMMPSWLQRCYTSSFHTRSGAFVVLHLVLDVLVFAEYTWEVFDYCVELEINWLLLLLPYVFITVNLYYLYKCSVSDPGVVTQQNQETCMQVYEYDNLLYHVGRECRTCHLPKPARSKHCSVCGCCVQRFDHHCVWVNNCIGALNIRLFLFYLFSLTLTVLSLAGVITLFILQVVLLSHMMSAAYVDADGREQIMGIVVIVQHLFLTFPRIVFTLGFLFILIFLIGGYGAFMLYLCVSNQTTNEWYKARRPGLTAQLVFGSYKGYSRGLVANLQEIFLPHSYHKKSR
ncbi:palmitoyltransferase ZDHHC4 [Pelodytes ibericus]